MPERRQLALQRLEPQDQRLHEVCEPADEADVARPRRNAGPHARLEVDLRHRPAEDAPLLVGDEAHVEVDSEVLATHRASIPRVASTEVNDRSTPVSATSRLVMRSPSWSFR